MRCVCGPVYLESFDKRHHHFEWREMNDPSWAEGPRRTRGELKTNCEPIASKLKTNYRSMDSELKTNYKLIKARRHILCSLTNITLELLRHIFGLFVCRYDENCRIRLCFLLTEYLVEVLLCVVGAAVLEDMYHGNRHLESIHGAVHVEVETVERWNVGRGRP